MEFKEAMRVIKRICAIQNGCEKCELELNCPFLKIPSELDYDKTEAILAKWAEEHPEKTIADDFLEKHPKATTYHDGTPFVCAKYCGYGEPKICQTVGEPCVLCWRRPLEEVEG